MSLYIPHGNCPQCSHKFSYVSTLLNSNIDKPRPNDVTICSNCTCILVFKNDLSVRKMTPDEIFNYDYDFLIQITEAQRLVRENKSRKN